MKKLRLPDRLTNFLKKDEVVKYLISVSLIVVSLLLTGRVERWREARRDREKLQEYLVAIQADIREELETCRMNDRDCLRDQYALADILNLAARHDISKSDSVLFNYLNVLVRGVFREFPPTTFDMMVQSGDARLIKNLELRGQLAAAFAFRQNILQVDLQNYDRELVACTEKLGKFIDFVSLYSGDSTRSWLDREAFFNTPRNEVFQLFRNVEVRGFHLTEAIDGFSKLDSLVTAELARQ